MKITKIEIETKNKKHRTDIAMLVDKIDFLRDVQALREKWDINIIYKPSQFDKFLNWDIAGDKDRISDYKRAEKRLVEFSQDVVNLRNKYNRTKNFDIVIKYAIGCNCIPEGVYRSCYLDTVLVSQKDNPDNTKNYQFAIVLSPRTEKQEVEEVFAEFQEFIKSKIEFHKHDWPYISGLEDHIKRHAFGVVYPSADIAKFKTLKELDRTREWYWMRYGEKVNDDAKKEKTFDLVTNEWKRKCPYGDKRNLDKAPEGHNCDYCEFDEQNRIEKAVSDYIDLLRKS